MRRRMNIPVNMSTVHMRNKVRIPESITVPLTSSPVKRPSL